MAEPEKKDYARRCESHVEALRAAVPGAIEKVEWQCEDQLTITVKQDKLPEDIAEVHVDLTLNDDGLIYLARDHRQR